jgi:hypothetical protein
LPTTPYARVAGGSDPLGVASNPVGRVPGGAADPSDRAPPRPAGVSCAAVRQRR